MAVQILVVEDNPYDVELVSEALTTWKRSAILHTVADGVDALKFLKKEPPFAAAPVPDLILLDLNLPHMNGLELLDQIKQHPTLSLIPVIVLTTSDREADVRGAYSRHANSYMTKPLDIDEFMRKVQAIESYWMESSRRPALQSRS